MNHIEDLKTCSIGDGEVEQYYECRVCGKTGKPIYFPNGTREPFDPEADYGQPGHVEGECTWLDLETNAELRQSMEE